MSRCSSGDLLLLSRYENKSPLGEGDSRLKLDYKFRHTLYAVREENNENTFIARPAVRVHYSRTGKLASAGCYGANHDS